MSGSSPAPQILARPQAPAIAYHLLPADREKMQGDGRTQAALPGIVFLGGFNSNMTGTKAVAISEFCRGRGQACLRFDYRGHGASGGRFRDGTIGLWLEDALDAFDRLTEGPQILVGSSMGGWLMLLLALRQPERIAGLVGLAAAPDFTENIWREFSAGQQQELLSRGEIKRPSAYSDEPYVVTRALIEDGRRHFLLESEIDLDCPVRLLHGMADPDVSPAKSLRIAEQLRSQDAIVTLIKDGDHRLARPQDLQRLYDAVHELSARADA
jgi:pimeloyl-ACP methyl ester carboxylesterase